MFFFLVQEDLDPFEMMEAVNILDRLSKDFYDKIVTIHRLFILFIFLYLRNQNNGKNVKKF
jgi:hypothetical protein